VLTWFLHRKTAAKKGKSIRERKIFKHNCQGVLTCNAWHAHALWARSVQTCYMRNVAALVPVAQLY